MKHTKLNFVDLLGRFLFGGLALLASIAFAAFAILLLTVQPVGFAKIMLHTLLIDCFAVGSLFMLVATLKSLSNAVWIDEILRRLTPKAGLLVVGFALAVCVRATWEIVAG